MNEIDTTDAPPSIGPFSRGIVSGDRMYVSGQGPIDSGTGDVVTGDVGEQTGRTLENVAAVLRAAVRAIADVVTATVYPCDVDDYATVDDAYGECVTEPYPARSAVEVVELPVDIDVEREVVAERGP